MKSNTPLDLVRLAVVDLNPVSPAPSTVASSLPDFTKVADRDWGEARRRLDLIAPLLDGTRSPRAVIVERARAAGLDASTLYRWARAYRASELLSSLLRINPAAAGAKAGLMPGLRRSSNSRSASTSSRGNSGRSGRRRWKWRASAAKRSCVRRTPTRFASESRRFQRGNEHLGRRSHRKAAVDQFAPRPGVFDSAQRPLDLVQIDHTKLDIIVVDDEQRLPIGRALITLAIDVYSRMVAGFYISLDPPGAIATGLCIAHVMLPKEAWLAKLGVDGPWPCWGLAARIHLDNAKEFHGEMLRRACEQYGIVLEYRPGGATAHGQSYRAAAGNAHGRAARVTRCDVLESAAARNLRFRCNGRDDAARNRTWLTEYIVGVYHAKHQSQDPEVAVPTRWTAGVMGDPETDGCWQSTSTSTRSRYAAGPPRARRTAGIIRRRLEQGGQSGESRLIPYTR
jgi:putative transposase